MNVNLCRKASGLPYLSKCDMEEYAEAFLNEFNANLLKEPVPIPIEEFLEQHLKLEMDYADITPDRSILGLTAFDSGHILVYDSEKRTGRRIYVDKGTVVIDNSLLRDGQEGRCRFTCAHEGGHWIFHRDMFNSCREEVYSCEMTNQTDGQSMKNLKRNNQCFSCRRKFLTDEDWMEWQANFMSSCLLMPKKTFFMAASKIFKRVGIEEKYIELGKNKHLDNFSRRIPVEMSNIFNVSIQAAYIRLKELKIIRESLEQLVVN